jgi:molybdopterin molybdotransferase
MSTGPEFEVSWEQARQLSHQSAVPTSSITLPLHEAAGHVLSQDVLALVDMPPFAASRIDGWAVNGPGPWTQIGDALAGHEFQRNLDVGECIHIATGAVLPSGATAVVKEEESQLNGDIVSVIGKGVELLDETGSLPFFHDVRPQGYEAKAGEVLIPKGTKLSPALIGVAAGGGHDQLSVFQKIVIDVFIFGDELVTSGPSRDGKVRDSLGPQLPLWIDYIGAKLNKVELVADTLEDHVAAISGSKADLIVTTGGTASGPVDHLHKAVEDAGGQFVVDAVLVRPGYHQLLAKIGQQFLIGLPGNPQSAVIGLLTLAAPFIAGTNGQPIPKLSTCQISQDVKGPVNEVRLALCSLESNIATPVEHLDSSMLRGFVNADGYVVLPPGGAGAGQIVPWLVLP